MTYAGAPEDIKKAAETLSDTFRRITECDQPSADIVTGFIAAALLNERRNSAWQPIETAPKDGTMFDAWLVPIIDDAGMESLRVPEARIREGRVQEFVPIVGWMDIHHDYIATHWMPLPPPPTAE